MLVSVLMGACAAPGAVRGPVVDTDLSVAGLSAPVRVLRDAHGIPYIFAASTPDLIRAQGFVTAQHRLFQIEGYRAMADGRLAEAIGPAGLGNDRAIRLVGLRRNAVRHAALLSPQARDFLSWYAEGMNAYITGHVGDHPVELRLAGFEPRPWTLEDMVTVLHYVNWSQTVNFRAEITMQKLIDRFGADRALRELAPVHVNPLRRVPVSQLQAARSPSSVPVDWPLLADLDAADSPGPLQAPLALGSNNWAIAPSRSASGAAVVVNDPHLDSRLLPGIWHPVGLFSPEIRAVGAALPAVPGLLVGRNAAVAFGVTNAYGDAQDLFIETIAPGQPDHYLEGGQARPFEIIEERIRIRDRSAPGGFREELMRIRSTVRGPVISGPVFGATGEQVLSLRMASAQLSGGEIGIDRLLRARDAAEVDRAAQAMGLLYFNVVFADRSGVIGHRASGRVPDRAGSPGSHPRPARADHDWQGFIPPEKMPGVMLSPGDPSRGWVGTANHDTRPDDYPYEYSSYFAASDRIGRMIEVLDQARSMGTADQIALLNDVKNLQALRLKPHLVAALRDDPTHADLARILEAWDGRDDQALAAPLLYHALYERLVWETFADDLGEPLAREWLARRYAWQELFDRMILQPDLAWFDDLRTPQRESLPDLIRRSAAMVRAELAARHGADPAVWRWGAEHRVTFSSPIRRNGLGRDLLALPPTALSGSSATIARAATRFQSGFETDSIASMRLVADLGDDEKIEAVVSGGVVDRQFHPHQKDQLPAWFEGRLLPWWFAPASIEAHARSRQVLRPAGSQGSPGRWAGLRAMDSGAR
jgi:penicillin amidase